MSTYSKTPEPKGTSTPAKVQRRREQNRASQRAYRDRKEKQRRDLEGEIDTWKEKHGTLQQSYAAQTAEVSHLLTQIELLNTQIVSLQTATLDMWRLMDTS